MNLKKYWMGKKVLITGVSSGIGWALVEALASYKIDFCLLSRRVEKMEELSEKLKDSGSSFWLGACDVRKRGEVESQIKKFCVEKGPLDVVWANSGISLYTAHEHWNWQAVEDMIDTNLKGAIYTIKAGLDVLGSQDSGALIATGSVASARGMTGRGVYCATKIALEFVMESLAPEFPHLQFTTIHPGFVHTPLNEDSPNRLFVVPVDRAVRMMIKAVARGKKIYIYPWQMRWAYRLIRWLPTGVFRFLGRTLRPFSKPGDSQIPPEESSK